MDVQPFRGSAVEGPARFNERMVEVEPVYEEADSIHKKNPLGSQPEGGREAKQPPGDELTIVYG